MPELQHRFLPGQSALPTTVPLATRIGRLAIRSLYREVALAPKPGLVTPWGNGSHDDMDYATFMRSLHALRPYFPAIAACGSERPDFAPLRQLGIKSKTTPTNALINRDSSMKTIRRMFCGDCLKICFPCISTFP